MGGFVDGNLNDKVVRVQPQLDRGLRRRSCSRRPDASAVRRGAHALYAPYYSAYIPATSRDPFAAASGTDGAYANNFLGLPVVRRVQLLADRQDRSRRVRAVIRVVCSGATQQRQLNTGATKVFVFTDEHGEARLQWQPGVNADFFADQFVDENGGCDLEGVTFPNQTITVAGRYPYQPVANDIPAPESITKQILNQFHKEVSCYRKNDTGGIVYICTVSAQDITGGGDVFNGEQVCISREPTGDWYDYPGGVGPVATARSAGRSVAARRPIRRRSRSRLLQPCRGRRLDISANFTDERICA